MWLHRAARWGMQCGGDAIGSGAGGGHGGRGTVHGGKVACCWAWEVGVARGGGLQVSRGVGSSMGCLGSGYRMGLCDTVPPGHEACISIGRERSGGGVKSGGVRDG